MNDEFKLPEGNFRGYDRQFVWHEKPDPELTEVGPGTPCGDSLRRHWFPVAMTGQVGALPYRLRVMSEDLGWLRGTDGQLGLAAVQW